MTKVQYFEKLMLIITGTKNTNEQKHILNLNVALMLILLISGILL